MGRKHCQDFIESYFKEQGCILLGHYIDARTPMKYICNCGRVSMISYDNFRKGRRCKKCGLDKLASQFKHDYEYVKKVFEEGNCELISDKYINGHDPLDYICECGNKSKIRFFDFMEGKRCWECRQERMPQLQSLDYGYVKLFFEENNCILLEDIYENAHQKLKYICSCGKPAEITFDKFKYGQRCRECGIKKNSGENHFNYNPEITDEERIMKRNYPEYREWAKQVKARDDYTCQCCGQIGYELVSHHIENYKDNEDLRLEIDNGITLCKDCHIDFHSTYGYKNTNGEQLKEFLLNKT